MKHRIKLLKNTLEMNFRMRFHGIKDMNAPETQQQLQNYKGDISNKDRCPCCLYHDYFPKSTTILPNKIIYESKEPMNTKTEKKQ